MRPVDRLPKKRAATVMHFVNMVALMNNEYSSTRQRENANAASLCRLNIDIFGPFLKI